MMPGSFAPRSGGGPLPDQKPTVRSRDLRRLESVGPRLHPRAKKTQADRCTGRSSGVNVASFIIPQTRTGRSTETRG
jgi:hypothetical protein